MNNKAAGFMVGFCGFCLIWGVFWMKRAFEYQDKLIEVNQENYTLEQNNIDLKYQLGEVPSICKCGAEKDD